MNRGHGYTNTEGSGNVLDDQSMVVPVLPIIFYTTRQKFQISVKLTKFQKIEQAKKCSLQNVLALSKEQSGSINLKLDNGLTHCCNISFYFVNIYLH